MPEAPFFWQAGASRLWPALLAPASAITSALTGLRMRRPGWAAPIPVICVGNVTVGGAGKTTVALDFARRLSAQGRSVHVLLRGYGGRAREPHWVKPEDPVSLVGDEALLYASRVPAWVGADRVLSAQAAVSSGAEVLLMDDGLQNPGLRKDLSLLVIDGASGFGNGRVFPAGPLREPVAAAARRCQAAVLIGADVAGSLAMLPRGMPVLRADVVADPNAAGLAGQRVLAFTGIAIPSKFFRTVEALGAEIVGRRAFPDHHVFNRAEREALCAEASKAGAVLVTTAKDAVRLPLDMRRHVRVVGVSPEWEDDGALQSVLAPVPSG